MNCVQFAATHFELANLGDLRLVKRLATLATAYALRPGCTIPQLFDTPSEAKRAYELLAHPMSTPDHIQAGHLSLVRDKALQEPGTFLLIEDTSEFAYSPQRQISGLGPVGNGSKQGFHLHSVIAVRLAPGGLATPEARRRPVEILGLAHQEYYLRKPRPEEEKGKPSRSFLTRQRERESQLWERSSQALGPAPARPDVRWVRVADRGADIYLSLKRYVELGHGWVVRASFDRRLEEEDLKLITLARSLPACSGKLTLELRARPGFAARTACLSVSFSRTVIRSPQLPGHPPGTLPAIEGGVVRVWEENPPEGVKGLEWILLTDRVPTSFEQARELVLMYVCRWVIEEFHRVLKEGMGAEKLQLHVGSEIFAAVSIMSVVALRAVDLRERVRLAPEAEACESGLSELHLRVLEKRTGRKLKTMRDVALAVGRLGGHMNRKGDGMPGVKTLYRGLKDLELLYQGARLFMSPDSS